MKSLESLTDNDVNGGLWLMEGPSGDGEAQQKQ
jgi:hypothetical protein